MNATLVRPPRHASSGPPPGAPPMDGGGGDAGWVALIHARNDIEAQLLRGRLGASGLEVRVLKDRSAPGAWLYGGSNPWAPATIFVRRFQLGDARIVLAEISFEAPAAAGPGVVTAVRDWRTPVVWWSLALGLGFLLTSVALARTAIVMERCELPLLCGDAAPGR